VPYQRLLDDLLNSVDGAQGAVLLDAEGEVVVEAGARDFRHRLIGAYQGIALGTAHRTLGSYATSGIRYVLCRYAWGVVLLRPLREGYYLILSLRPDAPVWSGLHRSEVTQRQMDEHL
jgi:predicted regulator of Ras-like GTPase activity (Roadblock/LC7/MglB family)